ncbi:MAG TPA: hypothetical protein VGK13_02050 [Methanocellaceae archaeon]|jgi:hypothetical protein
MMDDEGFDYGVLTGVGLMIAAALVLLMAFSMFRATAPANTVISLESAASQVNGDIGTVAAMAIPYVHESTYDTSGIDLLIGHDQVIARSGCSTFSRPTVSRAYPGLYVENDTIMWGDTAGFREYLNVSFNATGTRNDPIRANRSSELGSLMDRAGRSLLEKPLSITPKKPLVIEKLFIYTCSEGGMPGGEPYVFVYQR